MTESRRYGNAIVIGGSMAGLMAARVLSDHFAHVTLIERDTFTEGAEPRKGRSRVVEGRAFRWGNARCRSRRRAAASPAPVNSWRAAREREAAGKSVEYMDDNVSSASAPGVRAT